MISAASKRGCSARSRFNNAAIAVTLFLLWLRRTSTLKKPLPDIEAAVQIGPPRRRAGPDAWR